MNFVKLVNLILLISNQIKSFIFKIKKKEILDAKNESLQTGDQRAFENAISDVDADHVSDLPVGKYNGMYERAVKKKT